MCPVLFTIGDVNVSGYWGMTMLGLLVSYIYLYLANRRGGDKGLPWYHLNNICCLCILSIYIGGAIMGMLVKLPEIGASWDSYRGDIQGLWDLAFANRGFYGGLVMLGLTVAGYSRYYKLEGQYVAGLFVPACPLFMVFGRLACLMGGCCYGIPVSWGIVFPEGSLAPAGVALFPSQPAEALGQLALFFLLLRLRGRVGQKFWLIGIYTAGYAVLRFLLEFFRADMERGFWGIFSTSQWISIGMLLGVLAVYVTEKKLRGKRCFE